MKFIENVKETDYVKFYDSFETNHFLQSYAFGQANRIGRGQTPIYVGLENSDGNLVAAALLLKRSTPLGMCYFYSPRGFLIDFNNKDLLQLFTVELKKYLKREKAIYLRIDPGIMYHEIDLQAQKIEGGKNNYNVFNNLVDLGFIHRGFNKLYEGNQPRYTFRIFLNKPLANIESAASKTFIKTVKRSYFYDLDISESNDVDTFYELNKLIAQKDGFNEYSYEYYKAMFDNFNKYNSIKIFNASIYPDKIINKIKDEIKLLENGKNNDEKLSRLNKDLEFFGALENQYPSGKIIASLICVYTLNGAWTLYIGNDNIGQYTFAISRLYYEALVDAHNRNFKFLDLFGVCGDPNTTYKNLANIFEFKRKLGGDYIEFIGEFDLVNKPFWYKILPNLLKIYRKLKK